MVRVGEFALSCLSIHQNFLNMKINIEQILSDQTLAKMAAEYLSYALDNVQCYDELTPKEKEIISIDNFEKILVSASGTYHDLKQKNPNHIILIRCGHFYTTFDEDAVTVSRALGIKYNVDFGEEKRNQKTSFPRHALDTYLPKLIRAGFKVAVFDNP